nr:unnamed protein product [Spirometra erinaceieuropaei]
MLLLSLLFTTIWCGTADTYNISVVNFFVKSTTDSTPCAGLEIPKNTTLILTDSVPLQTEHLHAEQEAMGECSVRNGTFMDIMLSNNYTLHIRWTFEQDPLVNDPADGYSMVGAEPDRLHGVYNLRELSVWNNNTDEFLYANISDKSSETPKNVLVRAGNYYSCSTGWEIFLHGSRNATLHLSQLKFQAFPDKGGVNFTGHAVTCPDDHEHHWLSFHIILVGVCVGVVLVLLTYICIRVGTLASSSSPLAP